MLALENVSKSFGSIEALRSVSLDVAPDELQVEWMLDEDTGKVTVIMLNAEEKEIGIPTEKLTIQTIVKDKKTTYDLPAIKFAEGDEKAGTVFEIEDKSLVSALLLHVDTELLVEYEGSDYPVVEMVYFSH